MQREKKEPTKLRIVIESHTLLSSKFYFYILEWQILITNHLFGPISECLETDKCIWPKEKWLSNANK